MSTVHARFQPREYLRRVGAAFRRRRPHVVASEPVASPGADVAGTAAQTYECVIAVAGGTAIGATEINPGYRRYSRGTPGVLEGAQGWRVVRVCAWRARLTKGRFELLSTLGTNRGERRRRRRCTNVDRRQDVVRLQSRNVLRYSKGTLSTQGVRKKNVLRYVL